METKIRFQSASAVAAISQGGRTANLTSDYSYPPRVEIIPSQNNSFAPLNVSIEVKLVGFLTPPQNVWVWGDWGDPGGFDIELPQNVRMLGALVNPEWLNMNRVRGRFDGHVYDTPGTRTITVHAKDIDGQVYTATCDITATDPWDFFEEHIWIDPDGDFVDENGVDHQAAGDRCETGLYNDWDNFKGQTSKAWIHLRRGKTISMMNPSERFSLWSANDLMFSGFGEGNEKPVITDGPEATNHASGRIVFHGIICRSPNRWNPHTESWYGNGDTIKVPYIGSTKFQKADFFTYNVENHGGEYGIGTRGSGEDDFAPEKYTNQSSFVAGGKGVNFLDFGTIGSGLKIVIIGCQLTRDTEAFQGQSSPSVYYRYPTTEVDDPSLQQGVHTPIRITLLNSQGYGVIALCDLYSQTGWSEGRWDRNGDGSSSTPMPGYQSVIRLMSNGRETNVRWAINGNVMEGGAANIVMNGLGEPSHCQCVFENNLFISAAQTGVIISSGNSGMVIRNNISIGAPIVDYVAYLRSNAPSSSNPTPKSLGLTPTYIYGNTHLPWGKKGNNRDWIKYVEGKFSYQNYGGEENFTIVDHDNYLYAPNFDTPVTDGLDKLFDLPVVARYAGIRWRDKQGIHNPGDDQPVMYRGWEFPAFVEHNGEQQQTITVPVSNQPADGPNPLFWDFFYRERDPDNTVKGAVDLGVQVDTASGPKYTLMPYLKRTSDGTVRYHAGEIAKEEGDESQVGGTVRQIAHQSGGVASIARAGGDSPISGEVSYLGEAPSQEQMMSIWMYSNITRLGQSLQRERVDLPFNHIPSDHA